MLVRWFGLMLPTALLLIATVAGGGHEQSQPEDLTHGELIAQIRSRPCTFADPTGTTGLTDFNAELAGQAVRIAGLAGNWPAMSTRRWTDSYLADAAPNGTVLPLGNPYAATRGKLKALIQPIGSQSVLSLQFCRLSFGR